MEREYFLSAIRREHSIAAADHEVGAHVDVLDVLVAKLKIVLVLFDLGTRARCVWLAADQCHR